MGCVYSKADYGKRNPRIFQVWNVDADGRNVKPGRLQVIESELVLSQKGDVTVRWPLKCLRRYGFDAELFSFECGRRCPTGPGIYAFKCHRSQALFNVLQESLLNCGRDSEAGNISTASIDDQASISTQAVTPVPFEPNSNVASGSIPNSTFRQTTAIDSAGYLEPITGSHNNSCSQSSAPTRISDVSSTTASPRPNSVSFHNGGSEGIAVEWTANGVSNSLPTCCSFGPCSRKSSNIKKKYINREVPEPVSPSFSGSSCALHQYVNASVIATNPTRRTCSSSSSKRQNQSQSMYMNNSVANSESTPCCTGCDTACCMHCIDMNTNYAKLDDLLKQEQSVKRQKEHQHCYVNVKPDQAGIMSSTCSRCVSGGPTTADCLSKCNGITSPTSATASSKVRRAHVCTNLGTPNSVSSFEAPKPEEKTEVNYAILDLDNNNTTHHSLPNGCFGPNIPSRTTEGYVQIDFDRTIALSHTIVPFFNDESLRITRHSVIMPCVSMPS